MPGKIFVNYRRVDERAFAARVRDRLAQAFGTANVFMDVDNLMAGQRFDRELEKALAETDVFLAVMGHRWMDLYRARQASGERDYVHEEIAGALRRGGTESPESRQSRKRETAKPLRVGFKFRPSVFPRSLPKLCPCPNPARRSL